MNNYMAEVKKLNEVPSKLMKEDAATSTKEVETKALKPEDIKTKESIRRIAELNRHKRMLKIMTSISAVLLFACTLMAFGLFQGNEKIAAIEQQLAEVRLGYNNIISKINDGAFPTFAATDSAVTNKINQTLASKTPTTSAADAQSSLDNGLNVLKTNSKTSAKQDNKATQTFAVVPVNNNSKQLQQSKPQQTQSQQQNKTVQPAQPATPTAPTAPATPNVPTTQVTQTTQATPVTQAAPAPQLTQAAPQNSAEVQEPKETQAKQNYDVTASGTPNKSHKVAKGDTLSSISIKYYGDISMIKRVMQANNLNDPTRLKIGSVLVIPEK